MARKRRDKWDADYMRFRNGVLKRDNRKCQFPDCQDAATDVHHIKRSTDCPELRTSQNNGISLCKPHHEFVTGKETEYEEVFSNIVAKKKYPRLDILAFKYMIE